MPFGISLAPEVFQKNNEAIFGDIDGVEVIFDDIIIATKDDHEHDEIMRKLLQRAREANVKFKPLKLQYKVSEVKYMGNIVSESGLKPDVEKVQAIIQMPPSQNREELQRFLGMVNYFSQFIPNQSEINHCTFTKFAEERCSMELVPRTYTGSRAFEGHPVKPTCFKVL